MGTPFRGPTKGQARGSNKHRRPPKWGERALDVNVGVEGAAVR